jgi:WD40 repeat protein
MRWLWRTLGILVLLMSASAVLSVVVIMRTWPTLTEEEQFQPIHAVAFFPDGHRFATMNNAGLVRIWDVKSGKELARFKPGGRDFPDAGIVAMAVSQDGRYLAGASNRGHPGNHDVQVWDVATGQEFRSFIGQSEMAKAVAFNTDGRLIIPAGYDHSIRVWDMATGREVHRLFGHSSDVNTLAVTPDGRYVISGAGDYDGGQLHDPTIRMWDLKSGSMVRVFEGHSGMIDDISISPDGKTLVAAREVTVPAPPPHPFALMYADEFPGGIAVISDVDSAKELLRVGIVPRQPPRQPSR